MFFRPTRTSGDKRKRSKAGGQGTRPKGNTRKTGGKADKTDKAGKANQAGGKSPGAPRRGSRRLDSAVPLLRPTGIQRAPARLSERGAPLSDATQWLLERMRRLKNLDEYAALKQPFIERYSRDPRHSPASAERAFYQAVGVCIRRILEERSQRR